MGVRAAVVVLVALSAVACGKVQAKTPAPVVALNVPPPPERVAIPVELPEQPEPAAAPSPPPPATARPRPDSAVVARPAERPAPPPPAPVAEPPAPVLQTTTDTNALEKNTTVLLGEAQHNLDGVNYLDLRAQARAQYDSAMSFIKNARAALRIRNYMYAEQLAAKAAAVARELAKP